MSGRVAVIAVHGVGSPPPSDTARQVAELLTQHGSANGAEYTHFEEQRIIISTTPVRIPPAVAGLARPWVGDDIRARANNFMVGDRDRTKFAPNDPLAAEYPDVAFMRDQLDLYTQRSEHPPFETIELTAQRVRPALPGAAAPDVTDVHLYEMYWADLSRVGSGVLRVFGALYQLVLHLSHLGRKTVDIPAGMARQPGANVGDAEAWRRCAQAHAWLIRLFTIAVPIASLLMVAFLPLFVPAAIPASQRLLVGLVLAEVLILVEVGLWLYFDKERANAATVFVWLTLASIAAGVAIDLVVTPARAGDAGTWLLTVVIGLVSLGALVWALERYDRAAPGAFPWGVVALGALLLATAFLAPDIPSTFDTAESIRRFGLTGFFFGYLLLMAVWLVLSFTALLALVQSSRLRRALATGPVDARIRGGRALWTAKVTLTLSIFSFVIGALVGYQILITTAWMGHAQVNLFPTTPPGASLPLPRLFAPPRAVCDTAQRVEAPAPSRATSGTLALTPTPAPYDSSACARYYFDVMNAKAAPGLAPALLGVALALLLVLWFIVLIAITAMHTPESRATYSRQLGLWMTDGFRWMRRAGNVLVVSLVAALSLGVAVLIWSLVTDRRPTAIWALMSPERAHEILAWLSAVALGAAATLGAVRLRIAVLASRARPALGIVLDVDNYLRESPADGTPRAKIAERFASLLHHAMERTDANGNPFFDRVVILAHSQGTVITADLLRFLKVAQVTQPRIRPMDVRLLTMGCPLRQLYATNFPHLYRWIDRTDLLGVPADDDNACAVAGHARNALRQPTGANATALTNLSPSPLWLGVTQWVNLYTTGDYVGRTIWQLDSAPGIWGYQGAAGAVQGMGRRERCLGDGTHTRYWTTPEVAEELDALIA